MHFVWKAKQQEIVSRKMYLAKQISILQKIRMFTLKFILYHFSFSGKVKKSANVLLESHYPPTQKKNDVNWLNILVSVFR